MTDKPSREDVNISDYRINYNLDDWERIAKTSGELCAPIGAVRAVNALCDEIERNREAIAELVVALKYYADAVSAGDTCGGGYYSLEDDGHIARAAITKHDTQPTKKGSN